jgi:hypothetical protein
MNKRTIAFALAARRFCMAVVIAVGCDATASAQDLEALSRLVTPAYTAMSFAGLCAMEPGWSGAQPRGARGVAVHYAQHVKDEVIVSLTKDEAVSVLKLAANAARYESRAQLRDKVIVADKAAEAVRFREWCNGYVNGFIAELIRRHDGDHVGFLHHVEVAIGSVR